jgi:hypothetical protein
VHNATEGVKYGSAQRHAHDNTRYVGGFTAQSLIQWEVQRDPCAGAIDQ